MMTEETKPSEKTRAPSIARIFIWLGVFLLNFILLVWVASAAAFPHAGPLTAERLAPLPYFADCEILDVHTRADASERLFGQSETDWVLYRNSRGEVRLVGVEWSLYISRFRINEKTETLLPGREAYYTAAVQDGPDQYAVSVQTQDTIMDASGIFRSNPRSSLWLYIALAAALTLLEAAIPLLAKRIRKRRT